MRKRPRESEATRAARTPDPLFRTADYWVVYLFPVQQAAQRVGVTDWLESAALLRTGDFYNCPYGAKYPCCHGGQGQDELDPAIRFYPSRSKHTEPGSRIEAGG